MRGSGLIDLPDPLDDLLDAMDEEQEPPPCAAAAEHVVAQAAPHASQPPATSVIIAPQLHFSPPVAPAPQVVYVDRYIERGVYIPVERLVPVAVPQPIYIPV